MRFVLPEQEPQLIGRSSEALPITDTTVSRRHAELTPDDGHWIVNDLDSANGTFLNGVRVHAPTALRPGDQVRCGSTLLLVTLQHDDAPPLTEPIRLIEAGELDVTVERTSDPNDESLVLAVPDVARATQNHLRVIYALTALTGSTLEPDVLFEQVMGLVFDVFNPDRGFLLLGDDPQSRLEPAVVRYRERPRTLDEGRIPVSRTIIQHVLTRREGILSTNAMNDKRFQSGDSVADYGIRSAICVPITAGERSFGVIHIDSQLAHFTFTESQLALLTAIGQHTGLALLSTELIASRMQTERLATMGQTIASLSHSIKNILQGLRGGADAVELALNKGDLALAKEGWPILGRNLDRILALTLNMLSYSRQTTLDIELTDLHALINEVTDLLTPLTSHRGVAFLFDLADDMPPVPLDTNGLHQALMNILLNAIEAVSPRSGVVTIATRFAGDEAEIRISDNGPGMKPTVLKRAFDAFASAKGQRGTGLGLPVARKIIEEHGGKIELDSAVGAGTTVRMILPTDRPTISPGDTRLPRPIEDDPLADDF